MVDRLVALAFRCGFCHLLRASEYLNPSGSKLSRHCILAKHVVFQYRTGVGVGEMRFVNGSALGRLRIPYERITVYKITVPSAKNDVARTGRFHFGSAHRLVDGVDVCRELYDQVLSTSLLPDVRAAGAPMSMILFMGRWKSAPACLSYQVVGVNEYDRAMDYLQTPGVLSMAEVELLRTRVAQSVTYSNTCEDVDAKGFKDGVACDTEADEEAEEEHRVC